MKPIIHVIIFISILALYKADDNKLPLVINTWHFSSSAEKAWESLVNKEKSAIDSLEAGCKQCEIEQCDGTVGYGGSPDENGETTLDALIFDGKHMNMGAVGALRNVKSAISVAKSVLQYTTHSILVGSQATEFAVQMGFQKESLSTETSKHMWRKWKTGNCQPNFWTNVKPNPKGNCGPYDPFTENDIAYTGEKKNVHNVEFSASNHDTIGMIVIDTTNNVVAGTSTNGAKYKVPGRVGDSPIPGAGAYADSTVGAAAATGDGDVMMRFLPSFLAVEQLRNGKSPKEAGRIAIDRIAEYYPNFFGAIIVADKNGDFGAACNGMDKFHFSYRNPTVSEVVVDWVSCTNNNKKQ